MSIERYLIVLARLPLCLHMPVCDAVVLLQTPDVALALVFLLKIVAYDFHVTKPVYLKIHSFRNWG
jgi:hypothetical protein